MTETVLPACDRCQRPARRQALYVRYVPGGAAVLVGRYGPYCFYVAARVLTDNRWQPERENAKRVSLRGVQ